MLARAWSLLLLLLASSLVMTATVHAREVPGLATLVVNDLDAAAVASIAENCARNGFPLARTLRLTPALARAFAQSGHERLAAVAGRLDAAAGVVGGLATTCRD